MPPAIVFREITFDEITGEWKCKIPDGDNETFVVAASKEEMEEKLDLMDEWMRTKNHTN